PSRTSAELSRTSSIPAPILRPGTSRASRRRRRIPRRLMRRLEGRPRRLTAASSTTRASLSAMAEDKIRLGGMALANGVLVHGPRAWACAIRTPDGELKVESATKTFRAAEVEQPFLRGPARLAAVMLVLPQVRRAGPKARLPFERRSVVAAMFGGA